ncbi:MAG TPA: M13 family metallopeptidase N-terminal domain-containing protein, partial [Bacteroidales bacterium]|nr:M13 family metallopeptidase N-terminal domain-containing protein [Bacteroidales bacterium]
MKQFSLFTVITLVIVASGFMMSCKSDANESEETKALMKKDLDTSVSPKEDFYQYATGGWQKNNPLPEEESRFGSFDQLAKNTSRKVKDIIVGLSEKDTDKGSMEWKIGTWYSVGMDSATIEAQGIKPIENELERIENLSAKSDVIRQAAYNNRHGMSSLFYLFGGADAD